MNSILLDAQVTWIAPDKSSLKTCFFSKLSEISKCSRRCMADIEGSDGFCPMFLIEVFGVADIKDVKVRDEWACGCITCVRCPHKFDFPDCRNGLFDELYKEVSDGQQ